jgi:low affinity Fe/Cu permease
MAQHTTTDVHGISRVFHAIDAAAARSTTAALVLVGVVVALVAITVVGFQSDLEYIFTSVATAITLVMVFAIQHTQRREQLALQIKLDELLRALPQADDHFVHIEVGPDDELQDLEHRTSAHHASLREDQEG